MGQYDDVVDVERLVSAIAGPGFERTTLQALRSSGPPLLKAFADDDDIQEITVTSANIGMVRRYTKRFRKAE